MKKLTGVGVLTCLWVTELGDIGKQVSLQNIKVRLVYEGHRARSDTRRLYTITGCMCLHMYLFKHGPSSSERQSHWIMPLNILDVMPTGERCRIMWALIYIYAVNTYNLIIYLYLTKKICLG